MIKVTVGALIIRKIKDELNLLLTKRNVEPFKDYWCIPGGHIEQNEDAVSAVIREVKEETNLDFAPKFLNYLDEIFPERGIHNVVLLFHGSVSNVAKADPAEVSDIGWFPLADIRKMSLAFRHNEAVQIFDDLPVDRRVY